MSKIEKQFIQISYMDELAEKSTPLHRLHPLSKLLTSIIFIVFIVSFNRYSVTDLLPFFIFPALLIVIGELPAGYLGKTLLIVSPFALMVGFGNIFADQQVIASHFGMKITGGYISFASIMLKFTLSVLCVLILICTTGFYRVCGALGSLYVPDIFVNQLMFLYRYIFVLSEEAGRMFMAKDIRQCGRKTGVKIYSSIFGQLLLRTIDRAGRMHQAMYSRGFNGNLNIEQRGGFAVKDWAFVFLWCTVFVVFKKHNITLMMGDKIMRLFS
ncbi:MAG: cobalt ECF transporter T component CbiQ [Denitrovibrio sp.]|nr:MAG: cobalt ECF transporter T component CbiQ [Denitrovibrio sp.]